MKRAHPSYGWPIGYKVDPHHIYTAWPAWVLNAAIEGLPQVAAHRINAVGRGGTAVGATGI